MVDTAHKKENKKQQDSSISPIIINNQYIKDLSLEIPHAPEIFKNMTQNPDINIDVNVNANHLENNFFNVALEIKMNGIMDKQPLFILELEYAGVVTLNVPEEHLEPVLLIEIPRLLFPFARQVVSETLANAGLPPLMITPIDFVTMYNQKHPKK